MTAKKYSGKLKQIAKHNYFWPMVGLLFLLAFFFFNDAGFIFSENLTYSPGDKLQQEEKEEKAPQFPPLDKVAYDLRMEALANNPILPIPEPKIDPNTGAEIPPPPRAPTLWPVQTIYPANGALLPFNRIIAYYGNLYSKKMGVLGEYPEAEMLQKLKNEVAKWEKADPTTPAIPALHYIAMVAQKDAGADGKYRFRMPDKEIEKVLAMAEKIDAIVFLDIQVGLSSVEVEVPMFEKYLKMPNVHLGLDPEFAMQDGKKPGKYMGTMDAKDINFASNYLAKLVQENNLPPKILVVHRFTQKMVTNYQNIKILPEVQFVMDMDGWGGKAKKKNTYKQFIYKEPVQFTGFKIFYKNDIKEAGTVIFSPEELLTLNPRPIYIQYQ